MKLADTNIWLALTFSKHVFHAAAHAWLSTETKAREIAFCRSTQQSFLRLLTTAALVKPYGTLPFSNTEAWALYERYLADRRIHMVDEPRGLEGRWKTMAARRTPSPKLWMDAYLAAFASAGGYRFVTTDHGFAKYAGLDLLVLSEKVESP